MDNMPLQSWNLRPFETKPSSVDIAVKIMPTCMPLTAKICDAPAREKSFFILLLRWDLSAKQSALQSAEELLSSLLSSNWVVYSLNVVAFCASVLSCSKTGLGTTAEKYPKVKQEKKIIMPFKCDNCGDKNVPISAKISVSIRYKKPRLTSL